MNKKDMMRDFVNEVYNSKKMTNFIKSIFGYDEFYDYNYLFRMIDSKNEIVIDIYDNVSDNRFNRYIFSFIDEDYDMKVIQEGNVFVNYISIIQSVDSNNKLLKLAYLFKLDINMMIKYAESFLDMEFVKILENIIKKPI